MQKMKIGRCGTALLPFAMGVLLAGCASDLTRVAPTPPQNYQKLGKTSGTACGSLGLLATAYYAIPMGLNSRVERAYADALAKVPGATALIDVTYQEDWAWFLIATSRCVTVTGEAVK
jgi:hypothetical protein